MIFGTHVYTGTQKARHCGEQQSQSGWGGEAISRMNGYTLIPGRDCFVARGTIPRCFSQ